MSAIQCVEVFTEAELVKILQDMEAAFGVAVPYTGNPAGTVTIPETLCLSGRSAGPVVSVGPRTGGGGSGGGDGSWTLAYEWDESLGRFCVRVDGGRAAYGPTFFNLLGAVLGGGDFYDEMCAFARAVAPGTARREGAPLAYGTPTTNRAYEFAPALGAGCPAAVGTVACCVPCRRSAGSVRRVDPLCKVIIPCSGTGTGIVQTPSY